MNLYNLLNTIKNISGFEMVNSAFIGDVYEVNSRQDVEYPICVLTEGTHVGNTDDDTEIYSISLFLVDRLTEDKSNELDIKSWANEGVKDIISRIEELNIGIVQNGWQVNTFTERFESLCAGAYATIQIETSDDSCCGESIKMVTSINGKTGDVYIPGIEQDIVTSFNGQTGDITYTPDLSDYYNKEEIDNTQEWNTTQIEALNNKTGILETDKADKTEIPDVSIFNPTNNFKTINNESIIGTGNIHIEGGEIDPSVLDGKMDKEHPIFTETETRKIINPNFRLKSFVVYNSSTDTYSGTKNYKIVERWHDSNNMWIQWGYPHIYNWSTVEHPTLKYAAVKGFCRTESYTGEHNTCEYHLYLAKSDGTLINIDQFMSDRHVYGDVNESTGITDNNYGIVDSRDPNDVIPGKLNEIVTTYDSAFYVRNNKTYYVPNSMQQCDEVFNTSDSYDNIWTFPYFTSLINIRDICDNYSPDEYTGIRVEIVTSKTNHWHVMSSRFYFAETDDLLIDESITKEYVLIDELNDKADKSDIPNFKTINGQSIIGDGDITIEVGDNVFYKGLLSGIDINGALASGILEEGSYGVFNCFMPDENGYQPLRYGHIFLLWEKSSKTNGQIMFFHADDNEVYTSLIRDKVIKEWKLLGDYDDTELRNLIKSKADKDEIPDVSIFNPTNNFKTINGYSIIGTGDIPAVGGNVYAYYDNVFTGKNTFEREVTFANTEYNIPRTDISYRVAANFKATVTQSSVLYTGLIAYPNESVDITTDTNTYSIVADELQLGTDGTKVTPLGIYENGVLLSEKYAQLSNIPTVPTNVSAFNNDAGYLTEHQDISNLATKDELNEKIGDIDTALLNILWGGI